MTSLQKGAVTTAGLVSLALTVCAGIYLAGRVPGQATFVPALCALVVSALLFAATIVEVRRRELVHRLVFRKFAGTSLACYSLRTLLIGLAFSRGPAGGGTTMLFVIALALYSLEVPFLIGYTVARSPQDDGHKQPQDES
jgi:hypothetical protein